MQLKILLFALLLVGLCATGSISCKKLETDSVSMDKAPNIAGEYYKCDDMVRVVNILRHFGKEKSIDIMKNYISNFKSPNDVQAEKVLFICRLLFVNPNGWAPPRLGMTSPRVNFDIAKKYSTFPIILSDGVPFLVLKGYESDGFSSDTPEKCLNLCEKLSLIPNDFPQRQYKEAAQKLIDDEMFKQLFISNQDFLECSEMILRQAN